jgi:hypothetical protein
MPARPPVDVIGGRKGWSAGRAFNCLTEAFCLWRRQARQSSLGRLLPARTSIQAPSCPSGPGRMGRANEPVRIGSAQQLGSRTTPAARHSSAWAAASWASWRHHLRAPTGRRSRHGRPRGTRPPARPDLRAQPRPDRHAQGDAHRQPASDQGRGRPAGPATRTRRRPSDARSAPSWG